MTKTFQNILKGKVVIIGMGNIMRGDDGFGPALVEALKGKIEALCIDAGTSPENYAGKIIKENPDTVLFADATDLGLQPGRYEILKTDEIMKSGFTTHDISPRMFIEYLETRTKADIYMLGMQPQNIAFGSGMSDSIKKAFKKVTEKIVEAEKCMKLT